VLIIDEISMVRADILDAIDYALRINTNVELPLGGKQVIFIGDIFQLSPVVVQTGQSYDEENSYESPYFFSVPQGRCGCTRGFAGIFQIANPGAITDEQFVRSLLLVPAKPCDPGVPAVKK
jgi:hypothetical protein